MLHLILPCLWTAMVGRWVVERPKKLCVFKSPSWYETCGETKSDLMFVVCLDWEISRTCVMFVKQMSIMIWRYPRYWISPLIVSRRRIDIMQMMRSGSFLERNFNRTKQQQQNPYSAVTHVNRPPMGFWSRNFFWPIRSSSMGVQHRSSMLHPLRNLVIRVVSLLNHGNFVDNEIHPYSTTTSLCGYAGFMLNGLQNRP